MNEVRRTARGQLPGVGKVVAKSTHFIPSTGRALLLFTCGDRRIFGGIPRDACDMMRIPPDSVSRMILPADSAPSSSRISGRHLDHGPPSTSPPPPCLYFLPISPNLKSMLSPLMSPSAISHSWYIPRFRAPVGNYD